MRNKRQMSIISMLLELTLKRSMMYTYACLLVFLFCFVFRSMTGEGNFNWRLIFPFNYQRAEERIIIMRKVCLYSYYSYLITFTENYLYWLHL